MTTLYIIRHAEASGNCGRTFQGSMDGTVSDNGRVQLGFLAERMRLVPLTAVYSSPLSRTMETAEAVNAYHGLPIQTSENLKELDGGEWEGLRWAVLPDLYPSLAYTWNMAPWDFEAPGGETMRHLSERISGEAARIARDNPGGTVAVITHGCAIRALLCSAKGYPLERLNDVEWCDNTAVTVLRYADDGSVSVACENDASHLPADISTLGKQSWWKKEARENMVFDD